MLQTRKNNDIQILNKGRLLSDAAYSLPSSLNNSYMHKQKHHANRPPLSLSQGTVVSRFQRCMPRWALRRPVPRSTSPLCPSLPASWRWRDSPPHKTASTCRNTGVSTRYCTYTICMANILQRFRLYLSFHSLPFVGFYFGKY